MLYGPLRALQALLFFSGFTILAIEILGIRILAPYVGTTIPVWASLIGVTLAGSAAGYYAGGRLADRIQQKRIIALITAGASVSIFLIPVARTALGSITPHLSYGTGALIGSALLFFIPALCVGALVTYTIRLFVKDTDTIAQTHGDLYALATVGSICSVFFVSYALIPLFTVPHILYGLATILLLVGILIAVQEEKPIHQA